VKNLKLKSLVLASVIMMSFIVTSSNLFKDLLDNYELIENVNEEEQNEENKSEEKENKTFLEEFTLSYTNQLIPSNGKMLLYFALNEQFLNSCNDVLTPPPEFI